MAMILFFLYGEKLKAYLIKGARHIEAVTGIESGDWVGDVVCGGELAEMKKKELPFLSLTSPQEMIR